MSSVINDVQGVPHTFSSWDNCMSKAYCKWPAIVGIVIGSLIALSILWCIVSCLCCGATLCGACMKCLTCGNCCGACGNGGGGGGGGRRHKDDYSQMPPTPYQGYQPQPAPMMYNHAHSGPQFATFDSNKRTGPRVNEDALPAMPTWSDAQERHVEDHNPHPYGDDVEMGRMHPPQKGPYNAVPIREPVSPAYDEHYHQPYNSDLGAQRLSPHPSEYHDAPVSPMPVGHAVSPMSAHDQHQYESDRFAATSLSPTPNEYRGQRMSPPHQQNSPVAPQFNEYRGQQYNQHNSGNFSPYTSTAGSTRYEPTDYQSYRGHASPPPPSFHTEDPAGHGNQGYRPPSLLQAGRKPVPGSYREV